MAGSLEETIAGYRDALTVKRVFGEPYQKDAVTIIPAAKVLGGGGGGQGETTQDFGTNKGTGSGFGIVARPAGVYIIRGEEVKWQPAIDVNRLFAGLLVYAILKLLVRRRR